MFFQVLVSQNMGLGALPGAILQHVATTVWHRLECCSPTLPSVCLTKSVKIVAADTLPS